MADKVVLSVEIDGVERSIKSTKDFKEAISDLRKSQEDLELGSEAFEKNQKAINDLTKSYKELTNAESELVKLNKQLKEAQNAALGGDEAALKKVAELKSRIDDLNGSLKNVSGSGFEQVGSSIDTFKEGILNADFGKASGGLKAIGSAMKAIPIFLLVEGLKLLYENFDEIVSVVKEFLNIQSDSEKQVKKLTAALEEQKAASKEISSELEREIKLLEAVGGEQDTIIKLKRELTAAKIAELEADIALRQATIEQIKANTGLIEQSEKLLILFYESIGNKTAAAELEKKIAKDKQADIDKEVESIKTATETIKNLKNDERVAGFIAANKEIKDREDANVKILENEKKKAEAFSKIKKEQEEADKKGREETDAAFKELTEAEDKEAADLATQRAASLKALAADQLKVDREVIASQIEGWKLEDEAKKASIEKQKADEQDLYNSKVALANASIGILGALQGFAAKGSEAQKALAVTEIAAQTGVGLIQGLIVAQKAAAGTGPAAAFAFPIFLATQVGAVLSAALKAKAALSGAAPSLPPLTLPTIPSLPTTSTNAPRIQSANEARNETELDESGNVVSRNNTPVVKAIVVETDITDSQNRIRRLKEQSEF